MTKGPRILITNDDGVGAPGLEVALEIARAVSDDVNVLAPSGNQSGVGHRFSFGTELEIERRAPHVFAIDGTPADCVAVGMTHPDLFGGLMPDIVLSGVNNGQNLGDIINCSGTLAGAREAAMQGALGVAMSQAVDYENGVDINWDCALAHGAAVLRALIAETRRPGVYYNVNFPLGPAETVAGVRVVPHQRFARSPIGYYPSRNAGKFFIAIPNPPVDLSPEADFHVLNRDRAITVTPLRLDQSDHGAVAGMQTRFVDALGPVPAPKHDNAGERGGDAVRYKPDPSASTQ
ncbi:MAG: 5'/3'-nucleotidase SurE [Alphaproteobacteria bacterium]|nr:5'/3'-nucleotidase SurE [Alphaproteobacteria bacterium]